MPSSWLKVPHYQQELEHSCVPACARMVLGYFGDVRTEAELRLLLDTRPTGTRAGNLMRLSSPAFEVHIRASNLAELQSALADSQPPIVFFKTGTLDYWSMDIFHTAVLIGFDGTGVAIHDPYFTAGSQTASIIGFEAAWALTGQLAAFIRPRLERAPPTT